MKSKNKKLLKHCDDLWRKIVRLKANNKSELSGNDSAVLHCHHCKGKSSYALRFDMRGGICITSAEHYKAHATDNYEIVTQMRNYLKQREGNNIIDILEMQKNYSGADLNIIELSLKQQLRKLQEK